MKIKTWSGSYVGLDRAHLALLGWMRFLFRKTMCFLGLHEPGEHCGEVKIRKMDGETGEIDYGNVLRCPRCKKAIGLDNLH